MSYVWEEEYNHEPRRIGEPQRFSVIDWHLKKVWDKDPLEGKFEIPMRGVWRVTLAVVHKLSERKWSVQFQAVSQQHNDKTFRSLKAAKAYALAIITLEQ